MARKKRAEAIQKDVSQQDQFMTPEELMKTDFHSKRLQMLADISDREHSNIAIPEELEEEEETDDLERSTEGLVPEEVEEEPEPQIETKAEDEEEVDRLIIDGEQKDVSKAKIYDAGKRALQKELAADKRLEEASKIKKETEQILSEIRQLKEQLSAKPKEDVALKEEPKKAPVDAVQRRKWLDAIRYGEPEEAEQAFAEWNEFTRQEALEAVKGNESTLAQNIERTIEAKLTAKTIFDRFKSPVDQGGYADLANDPHLFYMANYYANKAIQEDGKDPNSWDTYREAGDYVRAWRDNVIKQHTSSEKKESDEKPDPLKEKAEKKKTIDFVPSTSARTVTGEKRPEDKTESPQDVIARMRKSRVAYQAAGGIRK